MDNNCTVEKYMKWYEALPRFIIIETIFQKEYKIAVKSTRFVDRVPIYMLLAETYMLGSEEPFGPAVENKFDTYEKARQAYEQLMKRE